MKQFKKWFIENFGTRPSKKKTEDLQMEWLKARELEGRAGEIYRATKDWDRDYELCAKAVQQVDSF